MVVIYIYNRSSGKDWFNVWVVLIIKRKKYDRELKK